MAILKKGLVQVYTGPGKGKTTAALGAAWRMLGAGGKVYVCQFLKPQEQTTGEALFAEGLSERLRWERLEQKWDMFSSEADPEQVKQMQTAIAQKLGQINETARKGEYDLMILDEINVCLAKKLARWEDMKAVIEGRAEHVELILTGRGAPEELIKRADLVTKMQEIKHPYQQDTQARRGIEY